MANTKQQTHNTSQANSSVESTNALEGGTGVHVNSVSDASTPSASADAASSNASEVVNALPTHDMATTSSGSQVTEQMTEQVANPVLESTTATTKATEQAHGSQAGQATDQAISSAVEQGSSTMTDAAGQVAGEAANQAATAPLAMESAFTWGGYFQAIGTLLILLALLWGVVWLVRRYGRFNFLPKPGAFPRDGLRLESQLPLGPRKGLMVVRFLNKRLLLGVTDHQITLLKETSDDEDTNNMEFKDVMEMAKRQKSDD